MLAPHPDLDPVAGGTEGVVDPPAADGSPGATASTTRPAGRSRRRPAPDVIGLALGVAVTCAYAALKLDTRSLWIDEAYTLAAANHPWLSLSRTHGTMGLYYVVMAAWTQVSTATWWLRLPSVLLALGSLVATRAVARRVAGPAVAAVAVPLLALVPMFEWKAVEARSYSLVTFLAAVGWYVALRAADEVAEDRDLRWWLALVPIALAGVLSHGLFAVHLAPVVALSLLGPRPVRSTLRVAPALLVAGGVAVALREAGADTVGIHLSGGPAVWLESMVLEMFPVLSVPRLVLVVALVVGLAAVVDRVRREGDPATRARAAVPVAWLVGPFVALAGVGLAAPVFSPRYLAPAAPGLALTLAIAAGTADRWWRRARSATGAPRPQPLPLASAVLATCLLLALVTTPDRRVEDWRAAAGIVAEAARPDDAILFANVSEEDQEQNRPPFEAAWAEVGTEPTPVVVSSDRPLGRVRRYEPALHTAAEMGRRAREHERVWIVDGRSGPEAGSDAILDDPAFAGLVLQERWEVPHGIHVALYGWADA